VSGVFIERHCKAVTIPIVSRMSGVSIERHCKAVTIPIVSRVSGVSIKRYCKAVTMFHNNIKKIKKSKGLVLS
jgi:hypothetical protein